MSKLNIKFNNTDYTIEESAFADAKAELETHLSSVMNGSGSVIKLGNSFYNIDSTKLTNATNDFVSHLGTISGSGEKVIINNIEYSVDSAKLSNAVADIEATLNGLNSGSDNGGNEGGEVEALSCLTFSSPSTFTLGVVDNTKYWDGILEYSTDANTWNEWDGTSVISSSVDGKLYMRGTGNTYMSKDYTSRWVLTGSDISCNGNIETLLDYATVVNGEHPTMASNCYSSLFYGCTSLIEAPELPATTLASSCYSGMFGCTSLTKAPELPATTLASSCYRNMFEGCTSLIEAPELPATTLVNSCYYAMFSGCTSLTKAPKLSATTLAQACCYSMFDGCTSLIEIPELPATTFVKHCYYQMFRGCTNIKLSQTQTGGYQTAYRIPISGSGKFADPTNETVPTALANMFMNTGGTFTGKPSINTTYYTSNTVV